MLAKDLVTDLVPVLRTSDTGSQALAWMDSFRVSHLPIVNNSEFLGLISEKDISNLNSVDESIGNHCLSLYSAFVSVNQHVFEVVALAVDMGLSVVPVLDERKNYLGVITISELLKSISNMGSFNQPGAVLVLEMNHIDYSLSQIAQIVEGNDAKILGLFMTPHPDSTLVDVTLKLNKLDVSSVIQTFLRYNYTIKASYLRSDDLDEVYNERYDLLMRYLNV